MSSSNAFLSAYADAQLTTASGPQLVVMLYDRLLRDCNDAVVAIEGGDIEGRTTALSHAQEIITALAESLDHDAGWDGSPKLASLYAWAFGELLTAALRNDAQPVKGVIETVTPLRDAWAEAIGAARSGDTEGAAVSVRA